MKALKNPNLITSPIPESDNSSSDETTPSGTMTGTPEDKITQPVYHPTTNDQPVLSSDQDLENLCPRIRDMKETLEEIIIECEESQFFCASQDTYKPSSSQRSMSNSQALLDCIS